MLKIGWGSRDVSTHEPVLITGQAYERISTGSMDPTTVTALYLEDGGDSVLFLSGDFTGFTPDLIQELKSEVADKVPGVDPEKIILNATHTHTAPRFQKSTGYDLAPEDGVTIFPWQKYRPILMNGLVSSVRDAYESRRAGFLSYGFSSAEISVQRRCVYSTDYSSENTAGNTFAVNGHGKMYGKTNQPDFLGYESGLDTTVSLLFTFDEKENLTGALINVPCPSQCTEHETFTSADFWNEAREMIREKHGNIFILPQCAAAGDLSPHRLHAKAALDRRNLLKYGVDPKAEKFAKPHEYYNRKVLGERIAMAFEEGLSWAQNEKISEAPIVHKVKTLSLDAFKISEADYLVAKNNFAEVLNTPFVKTDDPAADFKKNTTLSSNINRYKMVIERYEEGRDFHEVEIHVHSIGDVAFASNPFELYLDYQHRIQGRSPFTQTFIVQLTASAAAESRSGYLATAKAVANKGYSAIPFSCNVSPAGGEALVEETLSLLNEIHASRSNG
ncbi:MAG: hypothetical protein IKD31_05940 [Clostridia bacterium]|nr:hypothetical protein [Clostridia bacterium]